MGERTDARLTQAERLHRATEPRNAAVDFVARGGEMVAVKKADQTIETMAYEGTRLAILYKTPRVDLGHPGVPAHVNPRDFMIDVWFDNGKVLSVQWDHDGTP